MSEEVKGITPNSISDLDQTLVTMLNNITETAGSAKEFLVEQTPQVIQELLKWYSIYSFIEFIAGIILGIFMIVIFHKSFRKVTSPNWVYDEFGDIHSDPRMFVPIILEIIIAIIVANLVNLQWLKIWVAPKLWLIEYTADLVK